ncbi:MAG: HIT domain-containing protein [Alphaproteobacteria bacterium]|nr:HIT domain-containing protein [Alphaproteobacteria bacterium]
MEPLQFTLDPRLARDTFDVTDLPLCQVRLMDNRHFPWLVLVPRVAAAVEWMDLSRAQQHRLSDEIAVVSHVLKALVTPDKLNVAALGNQVSQLHVHLIARYKSDAAWPNPIWGGASGPYAQDESRKFIYELKSALDSLQLT